MLAVFPIVNISFTSRTIATNNYVYKVSRECRQRFNLNLGIVCHVPHTIIESIFYVQLTDIGTGRTNFKADFTNDSDQNFPWE